MRNKTESLNQVEVAFEYFLRVVKNHQRYHIVKKQFEQLVSRCNRNGDTKPLEALLVILNDQMQRELGHIGMNINANNKYETLTHIINFFLRQFLERGGVDGRRLGMYGQEIFDLTCYRLFGDSYLDEMDNLNGDAPRPTNDYEAFLLAEYMARKNHGENITYQDILNLHRNDDVNAWNNGLHADNSGEPFFDDEDEYNNEDEDDYFDEEDGYEEEDTNYEQVTPAWHQGLANLLGIR